MALTIQTETPENGIAKITLSGELDAGSAKAFQQEVEKAASAKSKRLVLIIPELDFVASAGLRVLIFAKQKMGRDVDVYVVGAQEQVMETLRKTGLHNSVVTLEEYDAAVIENI